jgi:hypothetical protein
MNDTLSTDPQVIARFLRRLRLARRLVKTRPARVVDHTSAFPGPAVRRLKMGLRPRCRGEGLELSQFPGA